MGDLSWNPSSWTVSNFAESAVEFVTGSEAAGDIAGLAGAWLTGDALGIASQAGDLGTNIVGGLGTLFGGVADAAKDAWKEFSNPGSISQPNPSQCTCGGYPAGEASGPNDVGTVGQGAGQTEGPGKGQPMTDAQLDAQVNSILAGGGSIEDKIFAILMLIQKDKKNKVEGKLNELKGAKEDKDVKLQELQKETGELSQMTQLTTNLMASFKQMKDSVIQNIR
jgi:hypothetical protein